jgi:dTDP-4-amino-4,6-dideoxygalactose transaminase
MWSLKEHGKSYQACFETNWPAGFRWLHEGFGTNARMTEMQAAIGRVALQRLPEWVKRRRLIASRLGETFGACPLIRDPQPGTDVEHSYYRRYCYVDPTLLRPEWDRQRIVETLTSQGVPCFTGSCSEIYLERAFDGQRPSARFPVAQELGETALAFLVHPTLEDVHVEWMCTRIEQVLNEARA